MTDPKICGRAGRKGMVLFAHGAWEPQWARPFEDLARRVKAQSPDLDVRLAFLEIMTPSLGDAVDGLVADGCSSLLIVPLFLGMGGHIRRDLPELVRGLETRFPGIDVRCAGPAGEDEGVLRALATYCMKSESR